MKKNLKALFTANRPIDVADVGIVTPAVVFYQNPAPISIFSQTPPPNVNVQVEDCERDVCPSTASVVQTAFPKLAADINPGPDSIASMPIDAYGAYVTQQVLVLGKSPESNTFNGMVLSEAGLLEMMSRYGLIDTDLEILQNEQLSTIASSAAVQVAIPNATVNADFRPSSFLAATRMRQFGVFVKIEFPDDVYYATIKVTDPQSEVVEQISLRFTDTECRDVFLLVMQANRTRFVTRYGIPNQALSLGYQLPTGLTDLEAPGSGAIETLTISAADLSNVQTAYSIPVTTWNIPYSSALADALIANRGIISPNSVAVFQSVIAAQNTANSQAQY